MTTIYFDGLCPLCSREIDHYRRRRGAENLAFVDIFAPGFDAQAEGLDPVAIHQNLHVRRADGSLVCGVDAFIAIWSQLPAYGGLARLAQLTVVRPVLVAGYAVFARVRPWLPRRQAAACAASPACPMPRGAAADFRQRA